MNVASQLFEILGLLGILASVTVIFVQALSWLTGRTHNKIRSAILIFMSFAVAYFAIKPGLSFVSMLHYAELIAPVLALFSWLSLGFMLDLLVSRFIWQQLLAEHGVSHVPKLIRNLVSLLIYAAAIMIVMHFVFHEPIGAVLATSGGTAFVIGFAAQKTLAEAFAGLSLSLSRTLRVGDFLEVNGVYGQVYEMNWRSIALKSPNTGSLHIFPNSTVASSMVLNFSLPDEQFKYWVTFVAELHASPNLVMSAVMEELRHSRYAFQDPKPDINLLGFEDNGIKYRVRYYFDGDDPWWDAQNEVVNAIWNAMRKHGFRFGIQRRLLDGPLEWHSPIEPNYSQPTDQQRVDALQQCELFADLDQRQLKSLAQQMTLFEWNPPEVIEEQDEAATHLTILVSGAVVHTLCVEGQVFQVGESFAGDLCTIAIDGKNLTTVQPTTFSRGYRFALDSIHSLSQLPEILARYERMSEITRQRFKDRFEAEALELVAKQHAHHHRRLQKVLKEQYVHFFKGKILSKLVGAMQGKPQEVRFLEAMIKSSSLIVVAGHERNRQLERELFMDLVSHIREIHHTPHEKVIGYYDNAILAAENDFAGTEQKLLAHLNEFADDEQQARLILATSQLLAGASGAPTSAQNKLLSDFAARLNIEGDTTHILAQ